jgi:hypothetical protein
VDNDMPDVPEFRTAVERAVSCLDGTVAARAALERTLTGMVRFAETRLSFEIAAHDAAGALRDFAEAWARSEERLTAAEAREIAAHPDLAELNVRLDGFYS